jgi:hypothetical protein
LEVQYNVERIIGGGWLSVGSESGGQSTPPSILMYTCLPEQFLDAEDEKVGSAT